MKTLLATSALMALGIGVADASTLSGSDCTLEASGVCVINVDDTKSRAYEMARRGRGADDAPGDDNGGGGENEPGDDNGGGGEAEPGDDKGRGGKGKDDPVGHT